MPAVLLLAICCTTLVAPAAALPRPTLGSTTTVTAHRTAGLTAYLPADARLRGDVDHLVPSAISIARRGGTYAFVGLSQPDVCRAIGDPVLKTCMVVHAYDFGALHDHPQFGDEFAYAAFAFDPPVLRKGRVDIYVVSDGDVTVTLRLNGVTGTRRLRANRPITAWMQRLPQNCPAPSCNRAGYGGVTHDVGSRGFVASFATAVREVGGPAAGSSQAPDPGTQFATSCIYPRSGGQPVSSDPKDHPTGCDLHPLGYDADWTDHYSALSGSLSPLGTGGGRARFDYAASGRVYVGYLGGAQSTLNSNHAHFGYGVWVREGIR